METCSFGECGWLWQAGKPYSNSVPYPFLSPPVYLSHPITLPLSFPRSSHGAEHLWSPRKKGGRKLQCKDEKASDGCWVGVAEGSYPFCEQDDSQSLSSMKQKAEPLELSREIPGRVTGGGSSSVQQALEEIQELRVCWNRNPARVRIMHADTF